jgi:hypothetical protein
MIEQNDSAQLPFFVYYEESFRLIALYAESLYVNFRLSQQKLYAMTQKVKLLDQVRAVAKARHLSHRTEDTYHNFIKRFILFHEKRYPRKMSANKITVFLTHSAVKKFGA